MNLRGIAAKKLAEQLLGECEEEYRRMWHNAKLTHSWPDYEDCGSEFFWEWLGGEVACMVEMLKMEIKDRWDLEFEIYQWGRGGATVAPDHFSSHGNGHHFNPTLDTRTIYDAWDLPTLEDGDDEGPATWVDAYKSAKAHLEAFQFLNKRVRESAAHVAEFWQEFKEGNPELFEREEEDLQDEAAG